MCVSFWCLRVIKSEECFVYRRWQRSLFECLFKIDSFVHSRNDYSIIGFTRIMAIKELEKKSPYFRQTSDSRLSFPLSRHTEGDCEWQNTHSWNNRSEMAKTIRVASVSPFVFIIFRLLVRSFSLSLGVRGICDRKSTQFQNTMWERMHLARHQQDVKCW